MEVRFLSGTLRMLRFFLDLLLRSAFSKRYFTDLLQYISSYFIAGRKFEEGIRKNSSLQTTKIKNLQLAKELEEACKKNGGFLTYSEYLFIEQFGTHGYHASHKRFGKTEVDKYWGEALVVLCKQLELENIVEFGAGDGSLGVKFLKHAKKYKLNVKWTGIEINERLQQLIRTRMQKAFQPEKWSVVTNISDYTFTKPSLIIFPYMLDNIPPEMFIVQKENVSYPSALMGVEVHEGILTEKILTNKDLSKRNSSFEQGIFTDKFGRKYDLRSITLHQNQRIFLPVNTFTFLNQIQKHVLPGSQILIIDEFRTFPLKRIADHLFPPKDLLTFTRSRDDLLRAYAEAGETLLYYPLCLPWIEDYFLSVHVPIKTFDIEHKMATELLGKRWKEKASWTRALLTARILSSSSAKPVRFSSPSF